MKFFKRFFYMDWNFRILFGCMTHEPQVSYTNKIRGSFNEMTFEALVVSVVANKDVAVQNR